MRAMKYIVFRFRFMAEFRIYLFPQEEAHRDFAARMPDHLVPVRAGMVMLKSGRLVCYGSAESLGLAADRQKDTALLYSVIDQG